MKETVFRCDMCGKDVKDGAYRIVWSQVALDSPINPTVHLCSHGCIERYGQWLSTPPPRPGDLPEVYCDSVRPMDVLTPS